MRQTLKKGELVNSCVEPHWEATTRRNWFTGKEPEKNNFTRTNARTPGLPQFFLKNIYFLTRYGNSCVSGLPGIYLYLYM